MAKLPQARFNLRQPKGKKQTLILLIFRFRGQRLVYSTGFSIHPQDWDSKSQRPIQKERRSDLFLITRQLNDIAKYCVEIFIESEYGSISVDTFREQLDSRRGIIEVQHQTASRQSKFFKPTFFDFVDIELAEMKAGGMNQKSLDAFSQFINVLRVFAKQTDNFGYNDIDWNFRLKLIDWLQEQNYSLSYGNKVLKTLRQFLERAKRRKLHDNIAYQGTGWTIAAKRAKGEIVILAPTELLKLYELPLSGAMHRARDLFLIGAATGQRFSDYSCYTPADFYKTFNGISILSIISQKTAMPTKVPLNIYPWLTPVLERNNFTSPKMKMIRYNRRIKEICQAAGIDEEVLIIKQFIGRKVRIEKGYCPKYTQVSSHTCRRSFATNLYRMGYSLAQIMPMTGHTTESQLREYIGIDDEMNAEEIALSIMTKQRAAQSGNALIKAIGA